MRRGLVTVTLAMGAMLVGSNASAQAVQRNQRQHYAETVIGPISSDTHYTVVASVFGSLTIRDIPLPHRPELSVGWVPGVSLGGQFRLSPRWRAIVRGSIQFPRTQVNDDIAARIFAYVASAEFVARYRFSDWSGWYFGLGVGPSLTITRATVCIFAPCPPHDESAAGISVLGTLEIGATLGADYRFDFGIRLQTGTLITAFNLLLDGGIYFGYHW